MSNNIDYAQSESHAVSLLSAEFLQQLDFSDIQQQVQKLKTDLFNQTSANHKLKIQLIKEELANGQYIINHKIIAEKLIEQFCTTEEVL